MAGWRVRNCDPARGATRGHRSELRPGGPPTPAELRLLCWAHILHGARGIVWVHHFTETPPETFKAPPGLSVVRLKADGTEGDAVPAVRKGGAYQVELGSETRTHWLLARKK